MEAERLLLNVRDVVRITGLSRNSVYGACARGELPVLKIGRRVLIPRRALEKLLGEAESPNLTKNEEAGNPEEVAHGRKRN